MREVLLPSYLASNQTWLDFVDSIDEVFGNEIDPAIAQIRNLRSPIDMSDQVFVVNATPPNPNDPGSYGVLTKLSDPLQFSLDTSIKHNQMLGFSFGNSDVLNPQDHLRIAMFISQYYAQNKGTQSWANFLGFVSNADFVVTNLWTQDYVTFLEDGDSGIGTPVYDGGTWYPTTHVYLEYDPAKFPGIDVSVVIGFFYYFANINLVLAGIVTVIGSTPGPIHMGVDGYIEIEL